MKERQFSFEVIKEELGYSAYCHSGDFHVFSVGDTFEELKKDMIAALEAAYEPEKFTSVQLQFTYDLKSFFDFYKVVNAKALAKRIGMHQSLLAQYIRGIKKPSAKQTQRILDGVHQIGKELCEASFIVP